MPRDEAKNASCLFGAPTGPHALSSSAGPPLPRAASWVYSATRFSTAAGLATAECPRNGPAAEAGVIPLSVRRRTLLTDDVLGATQEDAPLDAPQVWTDVALGAYQAEWTDVPLGVP